MKIGFVLPLLNGADHLAGILAQIEGYGKVAVIEFCLSESNNERSLDGSYEIAERFNDVSFINMGRVKDRRSVLNKGLKIFYDAEYIVILRQGDFFLDIQYLLDELRLNDRITTRRYMFYRDFNHFFLDKKREVAFRNIREFGELNYSIDPFAISSSAGYALKDYNVRTLCIDNILSNFSMISSDEKRKNFLYQDQREKKRFTFGVEKAKDFLIDDIEEPFLKTIDEKTMFLNSVSHPWKVKGKEFLDNLPSFPFIGVDEWIECLGDKYADAAKNEYQDIKPRVFGRNCAFLSNFFESEGWDFSLEPEGEYDLMLSISQVPSIDEIETYLKENGNVIVINSLKRINDIKYETIYLEEDSGLFSFVSTKRRENE